MNPHGIKSLFNISDEFTLRITHRHVSIGIIAEIKRI